MMTFAIKDDDDPYQDDDEAVMMTGRYKIVSPSLLPCPTQGYTPQQVEVSLLRCHALVPRSKLSIQIYKY